MDDQWLRSLEAAKSALDAASDVSLRVPCYCEENVWRLSYRKIFEQQDLGTKNRSYHVAFVSNPKACIPMFEQLAADDRETPVMWDYHVLLLMTIITPEGSSTTSMTYVLDIDSHLPCPCPLDDYIKMVFPNHAEWVKEYLPYFRVVNASVYLRNFSSDRSHMYNSKTKTWNAPPPSYDCIQPPKSRDDLSFKTNDIKNTISQYMVISNQDVADSHEQNNEDCPLGQVYSLPQLLERFGVETSD